MPIIDADTHIDETEATWEYLREFEQEYKPITQYPSRVDPSKNPTRYWLVDGHRQMRFVRDDNNTRTTVETRELLDVQKRLRDMDAMGTEVQVLYPTLFLMEATERPEVSTALRRSYNRWLADRCAESHGRLRWVCLPPLMNMDETIKELQFAKDHGACGILKERRLGSRQVARRSVFLSFCTKKPTAWTCQSASTSVPARPTSFPRANFLSARSCAPSSRPCTPFTRSSATNCR